MMIGVPPPGLMAAIAEALSEDSEDKGPGVDSYTASKMLDEFDLSIIKCDYKVGEFVTPTKKSQLKGRGEPHQVKIVFPTIQLHVEATNKALTCYNMVVAQVIHSGRINLYAAVSTDYEPYKGITVNEVDLEKGELRDASNM